jgi:hypothetical protein
MTAAMSMDISGAPGRHFGRHQIIKMDALYEQFTSPL